MITVPQIVDLASRDPILFESLRRLVLQANNEISELSVSVAAAAAAQTTASFSVGWLDPVKDFGARGDGVTDDAGAFSACLAAAAASGAWVRVPIPTVSYGLASSIVVGNGSASAVSAKNGIRIVGDSPYGCKFKWLAGVLANGIFDVKGPIQNVILENLYLDCNSGAFYGLMARHPIRSTFRNVHVLNSVLCGFYVGCYGVNPGGESARLNLFEKCGTESVCAGSAGWIIGESTTEPSPYAGVNNNLFVDCYAKLSTAPGAVGMQRRYEFSNTWIRPVIQAPTTIMTTPPTGTNGTKYPADTTFIGTSLLPTGITTASTWAGTDPMVFMPLGLLGGSLPVASNNLLLGLASDGRFFGKLRNLPLRNSTVTASQALTNPTTLTEFTSLAHSLEAGVLNYSGSVMKFKASGKYTPGVSGTLQIAMKVGAGTVFSATVNTGTDADQGWEADGEITVTTAGASGAIRACGVLTSGAGSASQTVVTSPTIDFTAANSLTVLAKFGTSDGANSITCYGLRVEIEYPLATN